MICGFGSHRASHSFGRRGKHTGNRQHTRGGRKCDERPEWIVQRLNDAEVQKFREGRDQCRVESLRKLQRGGLVGVGGCFTKPEERLYVS